MAVRQHGKPGIARCLQGRKGGDDKEEERPLLLCSFFVELLDMTSRIFRNMTPDFRLWAGDC